MSVVVTNIVRTAAEVVKAFAAFGVATVHEAQGRTGLMASAIRPIYRPIHAVGPAVTCAVAPRMRRSGCSVPLRPMLRRQLCASVCSARRKGWLC